MSQTSLVRQISENVSSVREFSSPNSPEFFNPLNREENDRPCKGVSVR
jgi:hypothetical protein